MQACLDSIDVTLWGATFPGWPQKSTRYRNNTVSKLIGDGAARLEAIKKWAVCGSKQ